MNVQPGSPRSIAQAVAQFEAAHGPTAVAQLVASEIDDVRRAIVEDLPGGAVTETYRRLLLSASFLDPEAKGWPEVVGGFQMVELLQHCDGWPTSFRDAHPAMADDLGQLLSALARRLDGIIATRQALADLDPDR